MSAHARGARGGGGSAGHRWLWAVLLVTVLALLPAVAARHRLEKASTAVDVIADYEGVKRLAALAGVPVEAVLASWRDAGIPSVAVPPYRLADVGRYGEDYIIIAGAELLRWRWTADAPLDLGGLPLTSSHTYILFVPPFPPEPVLDDLLARPWGGGGPVLGPAARADGTLIVAVPVPDPAIVHDAVLGLNPWAMEAARAVGMRPVPRWANAAGARREGVEAWLEDYGDLGPTLAIFTGSEALGFPYRLHEVADVMARGGLAAGWIEFTHQRGVARLIQLLEGQGVRVHSISEREMARLRPDAAVARWRRAVRERSVRALYVRPFIEAISPDRLISYNDAYVRRLVGALHEMGMTVGPARPVGRWRGPAASLALAALGVGTGLALLAGRIGQRVWPQRYDALSGRCRWLLLSGISLLPVAAVGFLYLKGYTVLSRQGVAWAATIVFPVLALTVGMDGAGPWRRAGTAGLGRRPSAMGGGPAQAGNPARAGDPVRAADLMRAGDDTMPGSPGWTLAGVAAGVAAVLAVTAAGVVILVAALADERFLLGTELYLGVKAAHVLPIMGVAVAALGMQRGAGALGALFRSPIRWQHGVVMIVLLMLLAVYVLRTGHDILGVAAWEVRLRTWLEATLPVRPRSKEIFIGYPALVAGLVAWRQALRGRTPRSSGARGRAWLLLAAGTIAPISVMNSFAHAHTPLAVSALRSVLGAAIGLAVGAVVLGMAAGLGRVAARPSVSASEGRPSGSL